MVRKLFSYFLVVALLASNLANTVYAGVVEQLQEASVTIKAGNAQGSGVIVTRGDFQFVLTAAHVCDGLRKTRTIIDPATGTTRTAIEFEDAKIVQEFTESGRRVGEIALDAQVIRYSDATNGEDLALLRIRKANAFPANVTTTFYLDEQVPGLGTELYHVGSLQGQFGANSLTTGIVSQIGRVLHLGANGVVFDQTQCAAFPGSSGGGVYLKGDGRYVGMLVRGAGETFNFIVPIRRLRDWAKRSKIEWVLDPAVPLPVTWGELDKSPVEDAAPSGGTRSEPSGDALLYPTLELSSCGCESGGMCLCGPGCKCGSKCASRRWTKTLLRDEDLE